VEVYARVPRLEFNSQGVHSLLYFAYTCIRDLFIGGGYLPCKNIYKVMVFYMSTCFTILESPILHVHFFQNLPTMNILDLIFYRTLFLKFSPVTSPRVQLHFYLQIIAIVFHDMQFLEKPSL
jgi:hypothetical protein